MIVRALTYSRYHGKGDVGSTRLRVHQLYKYWPEYGEYQYGENPDVLVFQKVYMQPDWKFIEHFQNIKILDICDPDWLEQQNIKETVDAVDGVVCPTESMAEFLRQLTEKPIKVIPDRHDMENIPPLKRHSGKLSKAVWFGYRQNADVLKGVVPVLERHGIGLTVISNDNPYVNRFAERTDFGYDYRRFNDETILQDLRQFDVAVLPVGNRPRDRFKSNNKATLSMLAGLPVVSDLESLEAMWSANVRNIEAKKCYNEVKKLYDVRLSVKEMQDFIKVLEGRREVV